MKNFQSSILCAAAVTATAAVAVTMLVWCGLCMFIYSMEICTLKFEDYLMYGRTEFLRWMSECVCVVCVTKMNVTRSTITQMNLTQNDKSWYEYTGLFTLKEFKSNEPPFFSLFHENFGIHKHIQLSFDWHWWRS